MLGFLVTYRFRGRFRSCCFSYTIMSRLNVTTTKKKRFIVSMRILWARSSVGGVVILSGSFKAYWCNIMMAFRHFPYLLLSNLFTVNGFSPSKQARAKNLLLKRHCVALLEPNFNHFWNVPAWLRPINSHLSCFVSDIYLCVTSQACIVQLAVSQTDDAWIVRG